MDTELFSQRFIYLFTTSPQLSKVLDYGAQKAPFDD